MLNDINSTDSITISALSKKYRTQESVYALKEVSLRIKKQEFFCLIGPSGSGKSTLLKIIAGLENPTSGSIEKPQSISMVFQSGALLPWFSVKDNAAFGLKMKGIPKKDALSKGEYYLEMVGLKDYSKRYPRELSGGQRQRVGIARALAMESEVLLLDEPFSSLDFITKKDIYEDLLDIWKKTNKTIVMVSHAIDEAVYLADRIGIMGRGELKKIVVVDIPRPRSEEALKFHSKVEDLIAMMQSDE